jgi:hypothetical protein
LSLDDGEVETYVQPYFQPEVAEEVERILAIAPTLLQPVPNIAGRAVSIRFRGLEVASVGERETTYPLGEPLKPLLESLAKERRYGSRHPLARAHEEAWLESNLIARMRDLLPVRQDAIYPQVPSFRGEERKIIDLLTITEDGRLGRHRIKAASDPDLPFQALDYLAGQWNAIARLETSRQTATLRTSGSGTNPQFLVLVAPLLSFHRTLERSVGRAATGASPAAGGAQSDLEEGDQSLAPQRGTQIV